MPKATKPMTLFCSESCHGLHVRQGKSQSPDNSPEDPPQSGPHDLPDFIHSHSPCHPLPLGHTGFLALLENTPTSGPLHWLLPQPVTLPSPNICCVHFFTSLSLCSNITFSVLWRPYLSHPQPWHCISSFPAFFLSTQYAIFTDVLCVYANRCYWLPVNPPSWILHEAREFVCLDYCCVPSV